MHLNVSVTVELGEDTRQFIRRVIREELGRMGRRIVSDLGDRLTAAEAAADGAIQRVTGDLADLKKQIADLESQLGANPTAEELARIDALRDKYAALDPHDPTVLGASRAGKGVISSSTGYVGAGGIKSPGSAPAEESPAPAPAKDGGR